MEQSGSLGIVDNRALLTKHKLVHVMKEREAGRVLRGPVQLDYAFWGGNVAR